MSILAGGVAWFATHVAITLVTGADTVKRLALGWEEETVFLVAVPATVVILGALASMLVIGRNYQRGFSLGEWAVFRSQRWMRVLLTTGK